MDVKPPPMGFARALPILALLFAVGSFASSFLILRQAPVAPEAHANELAEIRPLVEGEKLLFLGRDNFIAWELRGSRPFTAVRNFYNPFYVEPNLELEQVFSKFDFDSVTAETLAQFEYVLATRAAYASAPPPSYEVVAETPTYALWRRGGDPGGRVPAESGAEPGAILGCERLKRARTARAFAAPPVVTSAWSRATIEDGSPATLEVELGAGAWDVSLQYDSTRELSLTGEGLRSDLSGNLDYRGATPFLPAGRIELAQAGTVEIEASVERPPLAGRLLGAHSVAHLGDLALTRPHNGRGPAACGDYVDWLAP
jgi:hypothetical protein